MDISSPSEPVYYYECSGGDIRLVYFMPPNELVRLLERGEISPKALEDFPDGVDLGCTEPDFKEFEKHYEYRPPYGPGALHRAFLAIFSTTRDWERFRGSGFIPAVNLEPQVERADAALRDKKVSLEEIKLSPDDPPDKRRELMAQHADQQFQINEILKVLDLKVVDPELPIYRQRFSPIPMEGNVPAEEIFYRLHQKGKGKG